LNVNPSSGNLNKTGNTNQIEKTNYQPFNGEVVDNKNQLDFVTSLPSNFQQLHQNILEQQQNLLKPNTKKSSGQLTPHSSKSSSTTDPYGASFSVTNSSTISTNQNRKLLNVNINQQKSTRRLI
jgi:hypothetical protein